MLEHPEHNRFVAPAFTHESRDTAPPEGDTASALDIRPVIVVIEDDESLQRLLRITLRAHGYDVKMASTGKEGLVLAATRKPDLILLDLQLPDLEGEDIIGRLRGWWATRPIVVLSGYDAEETKVRALDQGADDYLTKPFAVVELLARIRLALRHAARIRAPGGQLLYEEQGVRVDLLRREVTRYGQRVRLTPIEYRLLATLIRSAGALVPRNALLTEIWGPDRTEDRHYLRSHIAALRRKLEFDPALPTLILTDNSMGYRVAVPSGPTQDQAVPAATAEAMPHV